MTRGTVAAALCAAIAVIVPAAALGVRGDFKQPPTSPEAAGSGALSVASANLGGSAHTDLAVANPGDDTVSILLGNGTGNLTPASASPEPVGAGPPGTFSPISVATAKLNGDAHTDLAVANFNDSSVSILLGDGSGNFTPASGSPVTVGSGPLTVVAANLDSGSTVDLATANVSGSSVSVLLGNGSGGFSPAPGSPEPTGGSNSRALVAAKLNGDANTDLAVANRDSDNVSILLGAANGDFTPAAGSPVTAGDGATAVAAASLGGSTATDLAVANRYGGNVSILVGNGSGGFAPAASSPEAAGSEPNWIAVGDLGGSAAPDLAVANLVSNNVTVLLRAGGGANFSPPSTSPEAVGSGPRTITAAKLGGDANLDLATANTSSDNVSVLINNLGAKRCKKGRVLKKGKCVRKCKKGKKVKKGKCVKKGKGKGRK